LVHAAPAAWLPQRLLAWQAPLWHPSPQWSAPSPQYPSLLQQRFSEHSMPPACSPHRWACAAAEAKVKAMAAQSTSLFIVILVSFGCLPELVSS
jgi:hypothetical protein